MMTKHEPQRDDFDIWPIKSPTGAGTDQEPVNDASCSGCSDCNGCGNPP